MSTFPPLIFVIGSTGTGKSDLAVELALQYNGEIINADAMQMYRGLPVLTNQLSLTEQRGVPHHLLGHVDGVDEAPWVVHDFVQAAGRLVGEIRGRGKVPIIVGGTAYYVRGLLGGVLDSHLTHKNEGLADSNSLNNNSLNNSSTAEDRTPLKDASLGSMSTPDLFQMLRQVDPTMADKWQPNDRRKIQRSLEIYRQTGRRASDIYADQVTTKSSTPPSFLGRPLFFWICAEPDALRDRLDRRVDKMLDAGLVDELSILAKIKRQREDEGRPVNTTVGIWQSIGVKQLMPYVDAMGESDAKQLDALKSASLEGMKIATRQYARYQTRFIKTKLVPHLLEGRQESEQDLESNLSSNLPPLYILDSTNPTLWSEKVSSPAMAIAAAFVNNSPLPPPSSLSPLAASVLEDTHRAVQALAEVVPCARRCELCGVTCTTEKLWEVHINGRSHRQAVKRRERRALVVLDHQNKDGEDNKNKEEEGNNNKEEGEEENEEENDGENQNRGTEV